MREIHIMPFELLALARKWEKDIDFTPKFRRATCAKCGRKIYGKMWHCWLKDGEYFKEIHLCKNCGADYKC